MDDSRPEWDNQPSLCFVCMAERDGEGKCKCPQSPSLREMMGHLTQSQATNDEGDD